MHEQAGEQAFLPAPIQLTGGFLLWNRTTQKALLVSTSLLFPPDHTSFLTDPEISQKKTISWEKYRASYLRPSCLYCRSGRVVSLTRLSRPCLLWSAVACPALRLQQWRRLGALLPPAPQVVALSFGGSGKLCRMGALRM